MFHALQGPMAIGAQAFDGLTLEKMLLQRHLVIDHLLDEAIADGKVTQVVEVACGMSGRGQRFVERHPSLTYVEADLPGMIARKRRALGARPGRHHLVAIDALRCEGPTSLERRLAPLLEAPHGTAIVTEGLLSYFPNDVVHDLWRRFARLLRQHPRGLYLSDVHLADEAHRRPFIRGFRRFLGVFARGEVHLLAPTEDALVADLVARGFDEAEVLLPAAQRIAGMPTEGPEVVRVAAARCGDW